VGGRRDESIATEAQCETELRLGIGTEYGNETHPYVDEGQIGVNTRLEASPDRRIDTKRETDGACESRESVVLRAAHLEGGERGVLPESNHARGPDNRTAGRARHVAAAARPDELPHDQGEVQVLPKAALLCDGSAPSIGHVSTPSERVGPGGVRQKKDPKEGHDETSRRPRAARAKREGGLRFARRAGPLPMATGARVRQLLEDAGHLIGDGPLQTAPRGRDHHGFGGAQRDRTDRSAGSAHRMVIPRPCGSVGESRHFSQVSAGLAPVVGRPADGTDKGAYEAEAPLVIRASDGGSDMISNGMSFEACLDCTLAIYGADREGFAVDDDRKCIKTWKKKRCRSRRSSTP